MTDLQSVEDELGVEVLLLLLEDDLEVGCAVADLVVAVHLAAAEQDEDVGQQVVAEGTEAREGGDGGSPNGGVLQDDAVVYVADVARRVRGLEEDEYELKVKANAAS